MQRDRQRQTLGLREELGLSYVAVDEPQGFRSATPPVTAATAPLAMIRLHGRNRETWEKPGLSAAERFRYLYSDDQLRELAEPARELSARSDQVHVLFNNCYRDYGVRNAGQMAELLADASN